MVLALSRRSRHSYFYPAVYARRARDVHPAGDSAALSLESIADSKTRARGTAHRHDYWLRRRPCAAWTDRPRLRALHGGWLKALLGHGTFAARTHLRYADGLGRRTDEDVLRVLRSGGRPMAAGNLASSMRGPGSRTDREDRRVLVYLRQVALVIPHSAGTKRLSPTIPLPSKKVRQSTQARPLTNPVNSEPTEPSEPRSLYDVKSWGGEPPRPSRQAHSSRPHRSDQPVLASIKYSLPLGLATLAAYLSPDDEAVIVDEHVSRSTRATVQPGHHSGLHHNAYRAHASRIDTVRRKLRGARRLHVTSLPDEARAHADAIPGPGEQTFPQFLEEFRDGRARQVYRSESGRTRPRPADSPRSDRQTPLPRSQLDRRHPGCLHWRFCYKDAFCRREVVGT